MIQKVLLVVHPNRIETTRAAEALVASAGPELSFLSFQEIAGVDVIKALPSSPSIDVAVVFGGDGTILRAAELVRGRDIPILGVNLGHVGFLAQVEKPSLAGLAQLISSRNYTTESRLLIAFEVVRGEVVVETGFALNEVVVESPKPEMVELFVHVDDRPLSYWGCDGVLIATPTGSTAYAFSAGGPVVWPSVDAMVLLPLAAHALFNRPMVVATSSSISVEVASEAAVLAADGFRRTELREGDLVRLKAATDRIKLAHVDNSLFTDRLVAKFKLPVEGWRGA